MTSKRNAQHDAAFMARLAKAHEEIHAAFLRALDERDCSQAMAARGMGLHVDSVRNYVHGRTPVDAARVLAHPRLRKAFRRALCSEHHDEPAAYVARKGRR